MIVKIGHKLYEWGFRRSDVEDNCHTYVCHDGYEVEYATRELVQAISVDSAISTMLYRVRACSGCIFIGDRKGGFFDKRIIPYLKDNPVIQIHDVKYKTVFLSNYYVNGNSGNKCRHVIIQVAPVRRKKKASSENPW